MNQITFLVYPHYSHDEGLISYALVMNQITFLVYHRIQHQFLLALLCYDLPYFITIQGRRAICTHLIYSIQISSLHKILLISPPSRTYLKAHSVLFY